MNLENRADCLGDHLATLQILFQIAREGCSLDHQLMPPLLDLRIGKVHRKNRGKCDAHCNDCCQRQSLPGMRSKTVHARPLKTRPNALFSVYTESMRIRKFACDLA